MLGEESDVGFECDARRGIYAGRNDDRTSACSVASVDGLLNSRSREFHARGVGTVIEHRESAIGEGWQRHLGHRESGTIGKCVYVLLRSMLEVLGSGIAGCKYGCQ